MLSEQKLKTALGSHVSAEVVLRTLLLLGKRPATRLVIVLAAITSQIERLEMLALRSLRLLLPLRRGAVPRSAYRGKVFFFHPST